MVRSSLGGMMVLWLVTPVSTLRVPRRVVIARIGTREAEWNSDRGESTRVIKFGGRSAALQYTVVMVMVMNSAYTGPRYGYGYGYILGPSPVPPIYLTLPRYL